MAFHDLTQSVPSDLATRVAELEKRDIVIVSDKPPSSRPDSTPWGAWFERDELAGANRIWRREAPDAARVILDVLDEPEPPTHLTATQPNAIAEPGRYLNTLAGGLAIDYTTTLNNANQQGFAATFPAGILSRISFEAQDAAGTALELGGTDIAAAATTLNLPPSAGNGNVTKIVWRFAYKSGDVQLYEVPVQR